MRSIERWHLQWPWWTHNPFSRSQHLWSRISQKRCVLGTKLLKYTNRKPYTIYRMVPLSTTLSDLLPWFQGHIFQKWTSQKRHEVEHSYYRTSIGSHMCSIERWHVQWPSRTPIPVFKVTAFLSRISPIFYDFTDKSFYRTLIGNHTQSIEWYHFQWPWVTSDPDFKVTTFFEAE